MNVLLVLLSAAASARCCSVCCYPFVAVGSGGEEALGVTKLVALDGRTSLDGSASVDGEVRWLVVFSIRSKFPGCSLFHGPGLAVYARDARSVHSRLARPLHVVRASRSPFVDWEVRMGTSQPSLGFGSGPIASRIILGEP